jgi:hypothetical protein
MSTPIIRHPLNELGRRLMAAVISVEAGCTVDQALHRYVPSVVDASWCEAGSTMLIALRVELPRILEEGKKRQ